LSRTYRSHTRQRIALAALVAACVMVVTLDFRQNEGGPIRRLQNAAVAIVAPLQQGVSKAFRGAGNVVSGISEIGSLRRDKARLEAELEKARAAQTDFPEVRRQRDRLMELMKDQPWDKGRSAVAQVIGLGLSNRERTIWIDKGQPSGVAVGMAVVAAEGLVGRVVLVSGDHAKVMLLVDPRHSVGSRLTNSGETGVITGRGQDNPRMELLDPTVEVSHGEEVVTSGYDKGIYPPGIPIGRIDKAQEARDGLTQSATVEPFVAFSRLDFVRVLLDSGPLRDLKESPSSRGSGG
jgi:rod shape-determining protein MreC